MRILINITMLSIIVALIFTAGFNYGKDKWYMEGYRHKQIENLPAPGVERIKTAMKRRVWG